MTDHSQTPPAQADQANAANPAIEAARRAAEQFYDTEIAPALLALSARCEANGFAFMAAVEFAPGEIGTVTWMPDQPSLAMVMLGHCARTGDNIDGYMLGLLRFVKEQGIDYSRSVVMRLIDDSRTPPPRIQLLP